MRTMIAVFIAAALALSGCGGPEAPPPESPVSPASPASQETPPEVPDPSPADPEEDALVREIILAYGGEMVTQKDGTHLKTKLFSLFQMPYSWHRPEEIPPEWRSLWFLTTIGEEETPLASFTNPPDEWITLEEPLVPLSALPMIPKLGDMGTAGYLYGMIASLCLLMVSLVSRQALRTGEEG